MSGTDLIKFWCSLCELDWDVWGTWHGDKSFTPERPHANECPGCLTPGTPHQPESLA